MISTYFHPQVSVLLLPRRVQYGIGLYRLRCVRMIHYRLSCIQFQNLFVVEFGWKQALFPEIVSLYLMPLFLSICSCAPVYGWWVVSYLVACKNQLYIQLKHSCRKENSFSLFLVLVFDTLYLVERATSPTSLSLLLTNPLFFMDFFPV